MADKPTDPPALEEETNEEGEENQEEDSPLGMSDEEFLKQPVPTMPVQTDTDDEDEEGTPAATVISKGTADPTSPPPPPAGKDGAAPKAGEAQPPAAKPSTPGEKPADSQDRQALKPDGTKPGATPPAEAAPVVDYKAEYERLLKPFKASGREITVENIDDAIQLMQMGANYSQKMKGLKPNLKLLKMLEGNDLLDEGKINYLIDLSKRNPGAINKLIKDGNIDPMDLDPEKASEYRQSTYKVDDREIELDTVLDELQGTPAYTRTLDIVSTKWDAASKQTIAANPQLLRVINDHVDRGIYDVIAKRIENDRVLGRLSGLSDIEAYRQVGDTIQAQGGFNHLAGSNAPAGGKSTPEPVVVAAKPKKADPPELIARRRAASSTRPAALQSLPTDFNPLALSDEEFIKHAHNKYV